MSTIEEQIRDAEGRLFARYDLSVTEHVLDLKVEGSELRVRVLEAGSGPPLVLLHPGSWFAAMWSPMLPHVPNRRSLCVDLSGHGLSGGVDYRKHDVRRHTVAMLRQLLSELGLGPVPLVGNSLGGMSALWLTADEPSLVSHLVIFGVPAIALPGGGWNLLLRLMTIPGLGRILLRLPSSPNRSRNLSKAMFGRAALTQTPHEMFEIHYLAGRRPEVLALSTMLPAAAPWSIPRPHIVVGDSELAAIQQPVRFLWGDKEIFGGPELAARAAKLIPDADVVVRAGRHFPQLADPEGCGRFVSEFLAGN